MAAAPARLLAPGRRAAAQTEDDPRVPPAQGRRRCLQPAPQAAPEASTRPRANDRLRPNSLAGGQAITGTSVGRGAQLGEFGESHLTCGDAGRVIIADLMFP